MKLLESGSIYINERYAPVIDLKVEVSMQVFQDVVPANEEAVALKIGREFLKMIHELKEARKAKPNE